MKAADIVVGESYAALGPNYAVGHWLGSQVTVTGPASHGSVPVKSPSGAERSVATRDIKCLWTEHVAAAKAQEEHHERTVRGLEETARKRNEAAAYLATVVPKDALPWWAQGRPATVHNDKSGVFGMDTHRYTTTELAAVVAAAIAHSQEA